MKSLDSKTTQAINIFAITTDQSTLQLCVNSKIERIPNSQMQKENKSS